MKATVISIALTLSFSLSLSAQTTATWQGGKPGRSTDWHCPANWSEGRVPDDCTQVVIPAGANYYPVIHAASAPIDALLMEAGATLSIQAGARLSILGETGIFDGATVLGQIENNGMLELGEAMNMGLAFLKQVHGEGIVVNPSAGVDTLTRR